MDKYRDTSDIAICVYLISIYFVYFCLSYTLNFAYGKFLLNKNKRIERLCESHTGQNVHNYSNKSAAKRRRKWYSLKKELKMKYLEQEGKTRYGFTMSHSFHMVHLPSYVLSKQSRMTGWRGVLRGILWCGCTRWPREALCDSPDNTQSRPSLALCSSVVREIISKHLELLLGHSTACSCIYKETSHFFFF